MMNPRGCLRPLSSPLMLAALLVLPCAVMAQDTPLGSEFTYQGRIIYNGTPVDGEICSIEFSLWDAELGGNEAGDSQIVVVNPDNGYFSARFDLGPGVVFGPATFAGAQRWLQLRVGCLSDPNANQGTILPRQLITATPYAMSLMPGARTRGPVDNGTALTIGNTTATTFGTGVKAETSAQSGTALFAESTADGLAQSFGVYATAATRAARAVYGESMYSGASQDDVAYGGYFKANARDDVGVRGDSTWTQGAGIGGDFTSAGQHGIGVSGESTGASGIGVLASGSVDLYLGGNSGLIVADDHTDSSITMESNDDFFIYLDNDDNDGSSVFEILDGSNRLLHVFQVTQDGDTDIVGDLRVVGDQMVLGSKSAVVAPEGFGLRKVYSVESPGNWFEDFGAGELTDGVARVELEAIFAKTVNTETPYHVFLTPLGDCALYVAEKTSTGFTVRARDGETCNVPFDYRVVAKRLGYEDKRLEQIVE